MLGRPWKPYQRFVADVAGEKLPDGRYAYHTVVVLLPRQSGKTTVFYDLMLGRGRMYRDYRCRYTTHKGTITSDRYADWFLELEQHPRLVPLLKLRRSRGTEGILWRKTRSYLQAFPPRDGALRSAALDAVGVDEAQEHDDVLGSALKRTITPTLNTRPRRQLWIILTAGTDASTYARGYVEKALAGVPGYAIFDYGCPDGVDPLDEALWPTWHPGLAYGLTDVYALRMALADDRPAFVREYGNRWTRTVQGRVVGTDELRALIHEDPMPGGPLCLGVDVAADRSTGAIWLAGPRGHVELLEPDPDKNRQGIDWIAKRARAIARRHGIPIAIDTVGPVGTVHDKLAKAGDVDVLAMKAQDVANAAADLLDDIRGKALSIWPHPDIEPAFDVLATRNLGDAGMAFSRRGSAGSIAPVVALAAARWGLAHREPVPDAPEVAAY